MEIREVLFALERTKVAVSTGEKINTDICDNAIDVIVDLKKKETVLKSELATTKDENRFLREKVECLECKLKQAKTKMMKLCKRLQAWEVEK